VRALRLRTRIVLWYGVAIVWALAVFATGAFVVMRWSLLAELDHEIEDHLHATAYTLEHAGTDGRLMTPLDRREPGQPVTWWLVVRRPDGSVVLASPPSGAPPPPARWAREVVQVDGESLVVEVGKSELQVQQRLEQLALAFLLGLPLALAGALLPRRLLMTRVLRPLSQMAVHAHRITVSRLGERLAVAEPVDELGELALAFNEAFARIERSFEQLKRFTADASHELRTPLTAMRSVGEVALQDEHDAAAYRDAIGSMLEEVDRMTALVEALLALARADARGATLPVEPVDLVAMAAAVVGRLGVLAEEKHQTIAVDAEGRVTARAHDAVLRQALENLVHNAIKFAPEGGVVRIEVRNGPREATIRVVDSGPGIGADDQGRVFDRFYRVDASRSRDSGGFGLGLAIARSAVEAQGGRLALTSPAGQGARFEITLPHAGA